MRILFFTESLVWGGKERRLLELIQYLKTHTDYSMALVITEPLIHFVYVYDIDIPIIIIKRKYIKYDPLPFIKFYMYCHKFNPDIIHAWGRMTTFYAIPSKIIRRIPLITSMITDAKRWYKTISLKNLIFNVDVFFSDMVLSNSEAGLIIREINAPKTRVIRNGVRLERFQQKFDIFKEREELGVKTEFLLVMVASFTETKDYDLFLDLATEICKIRNDVTFIAVGDGPEMKHIQKRIIDEQIHNVLLTGAQRDVEHIIAASDIGLLCTYSEGISNAIIEYMALGKPVISTDLLGGSKEIVIEGETGYCTDRNIEKIIALITILLDNSELRVSMGEKGRERINSHFSISRMGKDFESVYNEVYSRKRKSIIK